MKSRDAHPSIEEWQAWLNTEIAGPDAEAMQHHLTRCSDCEENVEMLRLLETEEIREVWECPPVTLSEMAAQLPTDTPVPRPSRAPTAVDWVPPDVRSSALGIAEDGQMVVGSFPEAQMTVMAVPPEGEGLWRINGRVWLRQSDERPIRVVLCLEDHVLVTREVLDGESFEIEELLGPKWSLEVHLPTGESFELHDPRT